MWTTKTIESPVGALRLFARNDALTGLYLPAQTAPAGTAGTLPVLDRAARQLAEYFSGKRQTFDIELAPDGTNFQRRVWDLLVAIPFGATRSYGDLAKTLAMPHGARAVGHANSKNPISIIVPCHRVIAGSGALTGYAGGMAAKQFLLEHELAALRACA
jgi:methylated-DNA-[protein]-cysteine S-methyltransferase